MDIIKKILCFSLLGDLFYFEKKSKEIEEVNLMHKMYRVQGWVMFIWLCAITIMYGLMLVLMFIPVINIIILFILIILIYIMMFAYMIYILVRDIVLLIGYSSLKLEKFNEEEVKYLKLLKVNMLLVISLYIGFIILIIMAIISAIIMAFAYGLGIFLLIVFVLLFAALGIAKIVIYVISRFKLYSIIKSDEF